MLCKHIHGLGTDFDADLEKVLPNCLEFSNYIKEWVKKYYIQFEIW